MVLIEEGQSFSMSANVLAPGYTSVVLQGHVVSRRGDGTYVAPLIPQLFLGASGSQLTSWRQWIGSAGEQVILSKPAGDLLVPREELYWRKVAEAPDAAKAEEVGVVAFPVASEPSTLPWLVPLAVGALVVGYALTKR